MAKTYPTAFDIQKLEKKFGLETLDYAKSWAREKVFTGSELEHPGLWIFHAGKSSGLETEVLLEKRMVKEWVCNCPLFQPKSFCVHVIAACAFIFNEFRKGAKPVVVAKPKSSDSLNALLQSSSNAEIQDAILMLGKQIPGIVHYFKANLLPIEQGSAAQSGLVRNFEQFVTKRQLPSKQISQKHQGQILDLGNYYLLISRQKQSQGSPLDSIAYAQSLFEVNVHFFPQTLLQQWIPLLIECLDQLKSCSDNIQSPAQIEPVQQWLIRLVQSALPPEEAFVESWYQCIHQWCKEKFFNKGLILQFEALLDAPGISGKWKQSIAKILAKIYIEEGETAKWQELLFHDYLSEDSRWLLIQSAAKVIKGPKMDAIQQVLFRENLLSSNSKAAENYLIQTQGPFESLKRKVTQFTAHPNRFEGIPLLEGISQLDSDQQAELIEILVHKKLHPYIAQVLASWYSGKHLTEPLMQLILENESIDLLINYFNQIAQHTDIQLNITVILNIFLEEHHGPPADHKLYMLLDTLEKNKAKDVKIRIESMLAENYPLRWASLKGHQGTSI